MAKRRNRELSYTPREPLEGSSNSIEDVSEITISPLLNIQEPHRSGKIIKAPDWFMFLEEVVSYEHDLDPNSYNKAIFNKDSGN